MTCKCGKSMFFMQQVHRYEPRFNIPDVTLYTCAYEDCGHMWLRYRENGDVIVAPYPSLQARKVLDKEGARKTGL